MSAVPTSTPAAAARRSASVLLAASIAIGSVSFTLVQVALEELSPLTLATGRVVVSALMFRIWSGPTSVFSPVVALTR